MSAKSTHHQSPGRGVSRSTNSLAHPLLAILLVLALVLAPATSRPTFAEAGDESTPVATSEAAPTSEPAPTGSPDGESTPAPGPTENPSPAPTDDPPPAEPTSAATATAEPTTVDPSPTGTAGGEATPTQPPAATAAPTPNPTTPPAPSPTALPTAAPSPTAIPSPTATSAPTNTPTTAATAVASVEAATPTPSDAAGKTTPVAGASLPPTTPTITPSAAVESANSPVPSSTASGASASSGDAAASGVDAGTTLVNGQQSGIVAGGGSAPVSATNSNTAGVTDMGSGTAQTGASGAQYGSSLDGTPGAGLGQATAVSGDAAASGVDAQNNVVNTSQANIAVGGGNYAPVNSLSSNQVSVLDAGTADAGSGTAIAKIAPTAKGGGSALPMATPIGTMTPNLSATPIVNTVSGADSAVVGPTGTPGPIQINHSQNVSYSNVTGSSATSVPTCAGAACLTPVPVALSKIAPGSSASAASGDATAQGLNVQNNVTTSAGVNIQVAGQNFAAINVVIETITNIVNKGIAVATSGSATASIAQSPNGNAATPAGPSPALVAASGDAHAAIPHVANQVDLNTSANVHVVGNNYNPIDIVLEIVVNIFNHGSSRARSGNAQVMPGANDGLGLFASSGSASATGLDAINTVTLGATANILIDGSNFAPITTRIRLITNIVNQGIAEAISGDAQATQPNEASVDNQANPVAAAVNDPSAPAASSAPGGESSALVSQPSPESQAPTVQSSSGSGAASGAASDVLIVNSQIAQVSAPGADNPTASNVASFTIESIGIASVRTGESLVGLTPTPVPPPTTPDGNPQGSNGNGSTTDGQGDGNESGEGVGSASGAASANGGAGNLDGWVTGTLIVVDPWASWPSYDLAPMPGQTVKIAHPRENPIVWSTTKPAPASNHLSVKVVPANLSVPATLPSMPLIHSEPQQAVDAVQFGPNGQGGPPAASPIELLRALALAALVGGFRLRRGIFDALIEARHRLIPSRGLGGT